MIRLLRISPLIALSASCTSPEATSSRNAEAVCGLDLAMLSMHPNSPSRIAPIRLGETPASPMKPRKRIENGDQLRACELPTARAIKYSCGGKDAVVTKIADDPYDERGDEYDFPDYTVSDVSCAFSNTERSAADCQFTISGDGFAERAETAQLRYIFMDLSDGIAHDYFVTQWTTDESCIAEKRSTTPNG